MKHAAGATDDDERRRRRRPRRGSGTSARAGRAPRRAGRRPARIRPVIAPGRKTIPSAARVLDLRADRRPQDAAAAAARAASAEGRPSASRASISSRRPASSSRRRWAATTPAFIALPTTIPAIGTIVRPSTGNMPVPNAIAQADRRRARVRADRHGSSPGRSGTRRHTVTPANDDDPRDPQPGEGERRVVVDDEAERRAGDEQLHQRARARARGRRARAAGRARTRSPRRPRPR